MHNHITEPNMQTNFWMNCVKKGAETSVLPACLDRLRPQITFAPHWMSTHLQFTFQWKYRNNPIPPPCAPGLFVERSCSAFQNTPPPQLEKPLQHKSILSDWLKRIWPLWLLSDHQKIVFTTTLSTTLTLTSSTPSMVV